ncbi:hypothetical protein FA15DRAFT_669435 [Coprinopsis marcescibilis]|uniref:LysM domain-containing protein n=1 Tax=Coprinopsis marcescibilis TaxID=230819 RepID=A0A5C3KWK7_COPMA|nr:hypothetical protein FA15DRAFT_669435 [Coprinopsis marcescibilis]
MFSKAAFAVASLAIFAQAVSAGKCVREYTIKEGDYCDTISAANKASTYQLGAINAVKINVACNNLEPGDKLCLGTENEDCQDIKVVVPGDTCEAIWSKYGVDQEIFYENNPQVARECGNIYVDEVLCVAKTVIKPPRPETPIHTGPPPSEATPPVPVNTPTPTPVAPVNVAPAPTPEPALEECQDEYEEIEVVEGPTDEQLPFCDEL